MTVVTGSGHGIVVAIIYDQRGFDGGILQILESEICVICEICGRKKILVVDAGVFAIVVDATHFAIDKADWAGFVGFFA